MVDTEIFGGVRIEKRKINPHWFIGKNTVIMGGSGGGKTVFAKYILGEINNANTIPIGICFDMSGEDSFKGIFAPSFIHQEEFGGELLSSLLKWQTERFELYKASCSDHLEKVYRKYAAESKFESAILRITEVTDQQMRNPELPIIDRTKIAEKSHAAKTQVMRQAICSKFQSSFDKSKYSTIEQAVIIGSLLNPNLMLVFDDCGNVLQKDKHIKEFFREMYSRGRHLQMTTLMLIQNDTQLERRARENVHQYFWTDQATIMTATSSSRGIFPKHIANEVSKICGSHFFDKSSGVYRLLGYDKLKGALFFVESRAIVSGKFGSEAYWTLSDELQKKNNSRMCERNSLLA